VRAFFIGRQERQKTMNLNDEDEYTRAFNAV